MTRSDYDTFFEAFDEAAVKLRDTLRGVSDDPDLRFFRGLQPNDLETLRQHYGDAAVSDFVREMGQRAQKGKK